MNNQEYNVRLEIFNVNSDEPVFLPYSIKQVNVVEIVIISMIYLQKSVCLMLLKMLISKYSIYCQELIKQDIYNGMKLVNVNIDYKQVFVIINNVGIVINADVNVKNWLTKEYMIKGSFGILVIVTLNAINHVMLETI